MLIRDLHPPSTDCIVWRGDSWRDVPPPDLPARPDLTALNAHDRVRTRTTRDKVQAALIDDWLPVTVLSSRCGYGWTLTREYLRALVSEGLAQVRASGLRDRRKFYRRVS